jgi:hypothetical protein
MQITKALEKDCRNKTGVIRTRQAFKAPHRALFVHSNYFFFVRQCGLKLYNNNYDYDFVSSFNWL